jgi:hypothetical protein
VDQGTRRELRRTPATGEKRGKHSSHSPKTFKPVLSTTGWTESDILVRNFFDGNASPCFSVRGWRNRARNIKPYQRSDKKAAVRLMRKLLKSQGLTLRVMVTNKLHSHSTAKAELIPGIEHRSHKEEGTSTTSSMRPTRIR